MIIVSISQQCLYHRRKSGVWYCYPVSTAYKGSGNRKNSYQTPLGRHRIYKKIGHNMPIYTAFRGRISIGIYRAVKNTQQRDWILSRILWLDGQQTGTNKRGHVDTKSRYIYIHGTHDEDAIGTPTSHGCIRMKNLDILNLFEHVKKGEIVYIRT